MTGASWIEPAWPPLPGVRAAFSLRYPGHSEAPWDGLNLAEHVDDDPAAVARNRAALRAALQLPGEPAWLDQVHGTRLVEAATAAGAQADASWSAQPGVVCAVMVADCLPVLLRDDQGRCVAALHAGWRGLAAGILERSVAQLSARWPGARWQAWLGPCIGAQAFEVGAEVRQAFVARWPQEAQAFVVAPAGRYLADLQMLARMRLARAGISQCWQLAQCSFSQREQFFSFRRDGRTGRMAALIWLEAGVSS